MLLRDTGPQLRTRNKKVLSVSEQKKKDQLKTARKKERKRQAQLKWMRRKASKAEVAFRATLAILPLAGLLGVLGWATTLPSEWKVEVSIEVPSDVHRTFAALQDLSTWKHWNTDVKATGAQPQFPAGTTGRNAIAEVHAGGEAVLRVLLEGVEEGSSVSYFMWKSSDTIPRTGKLTLLAQGTKTKITWIESSSVPDDVFGILERVALDSRAKEVSESAKRSLAAFGDYMAGAGRTRKAPPKKKAAEPAKEAPAAPEAKPAPKK